MNENKYFFSPANRSKTNRYRKYDRSIAEQTVSDQRRIYSMFHSRRDASNC